MSVVVAVCTVLLVVAAGLCVYRVVRSHGVVDRAVAVDLLTTVIISGIAVRVALDGDGVMIDVALVLGLLGFLTTATVARFLGRDR